MGYNDDYSVSTYRRQYDGCEIDTREGWAKKGFVVIQRRKSETMYTSGWKGQTAEYFYRKDVKEDKKKADAYLLKLRDRRNARRRELAKTKKDRDHAKEIERMKHEIRKAETAGIWAGYLGPRPLVLVFDTETTGLDADENNILSISWQLVELRRENGKWVDLVLDKQDVFFEWPEDHTRVTWEAIEVNGLTPERLAELGTIDRKTGLERFFHALEASCMVVAHNASFDYGFINCEARREEMECISWPARYCTMRRMTNYCAIPRYDGGYKWPRLAELALCLDVNTDDISFHSSGDDVEVTKRCFLKIVQDGIDKPF